MTTNTPQTTMQKTVQKTTQETVPKTVQDKWLCLPSHLSAEQFLAEYWQQKPLLIKQGLPQLVGMFEPDDILGLAVEPEASARLITQQPTIGNHRNEQSKEQPKEQWQVKASPLTEADFDQLPTQWTVLVQNLEQWSPELGSLWQAFDFIPQWQRDDIMVSYAPRGGSVGKHYDDYDVFLAQGYGHRRWQLGKVCDEGTEFIPDQPIRIFDDMGELIFDEVLEAGDVLYVPPKLSHFGVAEDDCLTFSFGFRRPNLMQVLDALTEVATSDAALFVPMQLPQGRQPAGALTHASITAIKQQLLALLQSPKGDELLSQAVSELVSKRQYELLSPEDTVDSEQLVELLAGGAKLHMDYASRLIYTDGISGDKPVCLYANGQRLENLTTAEHTALCRLADGDSLSVQDLAGLGMAADSDCLLDWLEDGWVWVG